MKTKLLCAMHACNGFSVYLIPETDEERALLRGLWQHGTLERVNGVADNSGEGFAIAWKMGDTTNDEE